MSSCASLNHVFRTVWNQALGAMVAVAEISRGHVHGSQHVAGTPSHAVDGFCFGLNGLAVLVASAFVAIPFVAIANPAGGVALVGQASMVTQGNKLTVTTQNGAGLNHSAINWQSFSIPAGNTTYFQQPSVVSTVINRVVTNTPSQLFGTLGSNGNLVLVNQAGITVGAGAVVDTAGFTASSLRMTEADALAGRLRFGDAASALTGVSVAGSILARSGDVVLLGSGVETGQTALLQAPNGSTVLAAGQQIEITGRGLEGISLQVQAPTDHAINLGTLQGGAVGLFASTLRHSGSILANTVSQDGGKVVLRASGDVFVEGAGRIVATGTVGGGVDVLGKRVAVTDQAVIDVSGQVAGGTVRVGGDYQGKNTDVLNAGITYFGPQASVKADATLQGDGGKVIVWADDTTRAYGQISARGGELGGNGGLVETSGKRYLDFQGHVDTGAPQGQAGSLLLDPANITISAGAQSAMIGDGSTTTPFDGVATGGGSILNVTTLETALSGGHVIVKAASGAAGDSGDITVADPVNWANHELTLESGTTGGVFVNAAMTATTGGALKLTAGSGGISQTAVITADSLEVSSVGGSVSLLQLNQVGKLAADVSAGSFTFKSAIAGGLTIDSVGAQNGVAAPGAISIRQEVAGGITVNQDVVSSGGDVTLENTSSTGAITIASTQKVSGENVSVSTAGGAITLNGDLKATTSTATLNSGAGAISGSGVVKANTIALQSSGGTGDVGNGSVAFNTSTVDGTGTANISIGRTISGPSGPAAVYLSHTGGANFTHLITTGAGTPVSISATGDLTTGSVGAGTSNLSLSSGGVLTLSTGAVLAGKNISLVSDRMVLGNATSITAGANTGDRLSVVPKTNNTLIDLGSATDVATNTLELSATEVGLMRGDLVRIGSMTSGAMHISSAQTFDPGVGASLETGGAVTQSVGAAISASKLAIKAKGNVSLDTANNSVGALAGSIAGAGTEYFHFKDIDALSIEAGDGVTGIGITGFSSYTAGSPNGVIALQIGGNLTQTINGGLGGAAVWATTSSGSVDLTTASNATGVIAGSATTGFAYKSSNTIALKDVNAHSGLSTSASGNIVLDGPGFSNSVATPFTVPSTSRWLVYANSPANVSKGGLTSAFRHYGDTKTSYPTPTETGSGFIYASTPGTLNVNTTLTSGAASHTYGNTPNAVFGYSIANSSIADTEDFALIAGSASFTPTLSNGTAAGGYTVSYSSGLTSAAGYTFAAGTGLGYTVDPAPVVFVPSSISLSGSRPYDGTVNVAASIFSLSGLVSGESLTLSGVGTVADKNVGNNKPVSLGSLALGNGANGLASNYTLSGGTYTASITPAIITGVTGLSVANKVYDGTTAASLSLSSANLIGAVTGDSLSVSGGVARFADKNVGVNKAVNVTGISLGGSDAGNYSLANPVFATSASISARPMSNWIGTAGNWSSAANWDVMPEGANVLGVTLPAGSAVTYDAAAGDTSLQTLSSSGAFAMIGGTLGVSGALTTPQYVQTGGALTGTGSLSVNGSFDQSAGSILLGGPVNIMQSVGNLGVANVAASSISLSAPGGAITQTGALVTTGLLNAQSLNGATLNDSGNRIGGFSAASTGTGHILLTNIGVLDVKGINAVNGNIRLVNTGGIRTSGPVLAPKGTISLTANSPLTIGDSGVSAAGDIALTATNLTSAGDLTINGPVNSTAGAAIFNAANNYVQNSSVVAASGVTVSAGGTVTFGPAATTVGSPVSFTSNGLPVSSPNTTPTTPTSPASVTPVVLSETIAQVVAATNMMSVLGGNFDVFTPEQLFDSGSTVSGIAAAVASDSGSAGDGPVQRIKDRSVIVVEGSICTR